MKNTIVRVAAGCGLALVLCSVGPRSQESEETDFIERKDFSVEFRTTVPIEAAERVADRVAAAIELVSAYLTQAATYEGPPYEFPIEVLIDPTRGPYQSQNRIHVPEQRVLHLFHDRTDQRTDLGIVHEITHVLAASAGRARRDRFYDDGLAVFLEHRFGQNSGYPNFGLDLYVAYRMQEEAHGQPVPLEKSEEVRNASRTGTGRRLAYIQEGAFTQFLIERYGLDAYFRIYHGQAPEEATGHPMAALEAQWRDLMASVTVLAVPS
jgi:hypothetical protein